MIYHIRCHAMGAFLLDARTPAYVRQWLCRIHIRRVEGLSLHGSTEEPL